MVNCECREYLFLAKDTLQLFPFCHSICLSGVNPTTAGDDLSTSAPPDHQLVGPRSSLGYLLSTSIQPLLVMISAPGPDHQLVGPRSSLGYLLSTSADMSTSMSTIVNSCFIILGLTFLADTFPESSCFQNFIMKSSFFVIALAVLITSAYKIASKTMSTYRGYEIGKIIT